jgi:hypothetical protein
MEGFYVVELVPGDTDDLGELLVRGAVNEYVTAARIVVRGARPALVALDLDGRLIKAWSSGRWRAVREISEAEFAAATAATLK